MTFGGQKYHPKLEINPYTEIISPDIENLALPDPISPRVESLRSD